MRIILAVLGMLFAGFVFAQCDLTLKADVTYKGDPVGSQSTTWNGLDAVGLAKLMTEGDKVTAALLKEAKKGGDYKVTFGGASKCGDKVTPVAPTEFPGVTIHGMARYLHAAQKFGDAAIKMGEDEAKKGKKRAWGKE